MKTQAPTLHSSNLFLLLIVLFTVFSCQKKEITINHDKELQIADSLQLRGDSLYLANKLDEAFNTYLQSTIYYKNLNKEENITYSNLRIATIYLITGDPNSAQELITKELPYIHNKSNPFKVYIYNSLAICYSETEDYELAIKYLKLSYDLATSAEEKAIILNNINSLQISLQNTTEAISSLQKIIADNTLIDNPKEHARVLNNLGMALYKTEAHLGLPELVQALEIRLQQNNEEDIFRSYLNLAEYFLLNSNYAKAHEYASKAYKGSLDFKNKKSKQEALGFLMRANSSEAVKHLDDYIDLTKQIAKENQQGKNQFAKIRYDFEKHKEENTKLKLDLQESDLMLARRDNLILLGILCTVIAIIIITYIYRKIRYRHRLEKIQQSYLTETKIAKKIHDELANDVFNTLTYTQNFNLETPETKNHLIADLESIYKKARNISLQHSSIATDETFITHLTNLFNEYNTPNCQVIISGLDKFDFNQLDKNQKITIYRVIQELLVNMKKHSMATIVVFKFSEEKKVFKIFYSDNGIGIIHKSIKSKNGLSNVENRITNIGGTFIFDETNKLGVKFNILLPKKNYV